MLLFRLDDVSWKCFRSTFSHIFTKRKRRKKMGAQRARCRSVKDMFYSCSPKRNWLKWNQFAMAVWDQQVWMGTANKSGDLCILQVQPNPCRKRLLLVCLSIFQQWSKQCGHFILWNVCCGFFFYHYYYCFFVFLPHWAAWATSTFLIKCEITSNSFSGNK